MNNFFVFLSAQLIYYIIILSHKRSNDLSVCGSIRNPFVIAKTSVSTSVGERKAISVICSAQLPERPRDADKPHPASTNTTIHLHHDRKSPTMLINHTLRPHTPTNTTIHLHSGRKGLAMLINHTQRPQIQSISILTSFKGKDI